MFVFLQERGSTQGSRRKMYPALSSMSFLLPGIWRFARFTGLNEKRCALVIAFSVYSEESVYSEPYSN